MSFNAFGHLFRVTTFGESHGFAIGCVVDGCPPRMPLTEADIQPYLDKRRPGQSRFTTQRREPDQAKILSGVFTDETTGEQVTTGTPIALVIDNVDQRAKDYSEIKDKYRPGHADYTYDAKYGIRDYRGGGRQSARETAMRVAAGAIARKIVPSMTVHGALIQMGPHSIERARWNWDEVERNPFFCPDAEKAKFFEGYLDDIRKRGSSVGAVIEVVAEGVPVGLGAPIYGKLDGDLAAALMGINAVKGVEIGAGFASAALRGEEEADEKPLGHHRQAIFLSNPPGGTFVDNSQRVEAVLTAFAAGGIVVVPDDDDRENEGDLFVAASQCTPEKMAFIIRHTSGIVCAPLSSEEAKRLHLDPMVAANDAPLGTAFTVSVDVRHGLTTGISAEERSNTVRSLANGNAGASDFVRPGHVFPLVAKDGGVLMRSGHTEACVDLCRLAGLTPVGVLAELMNDDGTVMRGPAVTAFAERHKLKQISIADLIAYRQARDKLVKRIREFPLQSKIGTLMGYAFVTPFAAIQHIAFVYGRLGDGRAN